MSSSETPHTGPRSASGPHRGELGSSREVIVSRRSLVILAAAALSACGFRPVYGPGGTGSRLQNRVLVSEPNDRNTFLLVRRIEGRLGRSTDPAYALSVNLQMQVEGVGIDPEGTTNRFNLIGAAGYVLTDMTTGRPLTSGTVNSFTGYFAAGSTVETLASERDARERLMVILADQIVARLLSASLPE